MTYYAKINTADPKTGFISVGEVLTEKQMAALGQEKLDELVREHVLAIDEGGGKPAHEEAKAETEDAMADEAVESADDIEDGDEELPELELDGDLVKDEAEADKPTDKPNGRRKGK